MIKTRIIPTLLFKDVGLVKGVSFESWRQVGSAMQAIRVYSLREVDELIFLDITASNDDRDPDFDLVDELADECFMPLTVGGGVKSLDNIRRLLSVGADKVSINSAALCNPSLIKDAAKQFGSQCIVISIDYIYQTSGNAEVVSHAGSRRTGYSCVEWAKKVEELGAGEILLTSVEKDGTMSGYDYDMIKRVAEAVSIPVIASGGAGSYDDMLRVVSDSGASAISAASIFHFTEQTPLEAKRFLYDRGVPVRL